MLINVEHARAPPRAHIHEYEKTSRYVSRVISTHAASRHQWLHVRAYTRARERGERGYGVGTARYPGRRRRRGTTVAAGGGAARERRDIRM